MNNDKVIVTNFQALRNKYGAEGLAMIKEAIQKLVAKDQEDSLKTQLIDISSATVMAKFKGKPVTAVDNQKQVKAAIDAIYKIAAPAYLMILGSTDVVPQQMVKNPIADPNDGDPDELVPTDLPYACENGFSNEPAQFIGPTRVVGRLPDMNAATHPDYLIALLKYATNRTSRPASDYAGHLGLSAWEWRDSTATSLKKLFGPKAKLQTSPKKGPAWSTTEISARAHFINCHGSPAKPVFYGQQGESYPVAHGTKFFDKQVLEGTVAAAECCYGADLYDPALSAQIMGICQAYLCNGAYGYCGSSTIAYGPAEGNAQADLLCLYFMQSVLGGASLGRAMLEARQKFAQGVMQLDPYDLKTLMQFNLFGDPSIHPVQKKSGTKPVAKSFAAAADASVRALNRGDRRLLMERIGNQIQSTQAVAKRLDLVQRIKAVPKKLRDLAKLANMRDPSSVLSFVVETGSKDAGGPRPKFGMAARAPRQEAFHVIAERRGGVDKDDISITAVIAREVDGEIVTWRKVFSR